ncbi:MAG: OB-fold nucleic acid binding domain-containing protein [Candidatus Pacearchaeota archaeon]
MSDDNQFKRNVAFKMRIGEILAGKVILDGERFKFLESSGKQIVRVNVIANVIDKYIQDGEKKYATITIDDASGQIKLKAFGDDIEKFMQLNQGDTILVIGTLRTWNNEIYITPEIIKKKEPAYLLVRKLEIEKDAPKIIAKEQLIELKDKIIQMIKNSENDGGANIDQIIMNLKEAPEIINQEIKKLLEDGVVYEPRPGKIRYLG